MSNNFVEQLGKKIDIKNFSDRDLYIFKIIMEIHSCHEQLKYGGAKSGLAEHLLEYYRSNSSGVHPITKKVDAVFFDVFDIPQVYSVEFDCTFPLISYPYKLFRKYKANFSVPEEDSQIIQDISMLSSPTEVKDFVKINRLLEKLSTKSKDLLHVSDFL